MIDFKHTQYFCKTFKTRYKFTFTNYTTSSIYFSYKKNHTKDNNGDQTPGSNTVYFKMTERKCQKFLSQKYYYYVSEVIERHSKTKLSSIHRDIHSNSYSHTKSPSQEMWKSGQASCLDLAHHSAPVALCSSHRP